MIIGIYAGLARVFYNREVDRGQNFHSLPENSMDVFVLGSSHAQYGFQPSFFHGETGLYSYVMGSACQPLEVAVQMLKEGLKTQHPKLVMLEVFTALPLRSVCHAPSCYVMAGYQMQGEEKLKTFSYLEAEKAQTYENDFLIHHNDWKNIKNFDYFKPEYWKKDTQALDFNFGYVYQQANYPIHGYWGEQRYETIPRRELRPIDQESLNTIKKICDENKISLLLFKTPIDGMDEENQAYLDAVWRWAQANKVAYRDFVREDEQIGFALQVHADSYHAYVHGSAILTHELAKTVLEKDYPFNHRPQEELDKLYAEADNIYTWEALQSERDPIHILQRLKQAKGISFLSFRGYPEPQKEELNQALQQLSGQKIDFYKPFQAIFEDGRLVAVLEEEKTQVLGGHTFTLTSELLRVDKQEIPLRDELLFHYWNTEGKQLEHRWDLATLKWYGNVFDYNPYIVE